MDFIFLYLEDKLSTREIHMYHEINFPCPTHLDPIFIADRNMVNNLDLHGVGVGILHLYVLFIGHRLHLGQKARFFLVFMEGLVLDAHSRVHPQGH